MKWRSSTTPNPRCRLEQLTTTLEPAILVVMGGVVVTILLAIYLPIIQSISSGTGVTGGR